MVSSSPTSASPAASGPAAASSTPEVIAFTRGVPAPEMLPAEALAECFQAVVTRDPVGVLQYGQAAGYTPLRAQLAERYGTTPEAIFVSNGSLQLMDLLAAHLVRPGQPGKQRILLELPSYDRAIIAYRKRGAQVVGIPLQPDGLDVDRLEAEVQRDVPAFLYIIPDFQNPSGISLSLEKRRRVVDLAERHGFWIVEDVPYRLLRYQGQPVPTLRELAQSAGSSRVITMSSYSKLVAPALRVGHLIAPPEVAAALAKVGEDTYLSPALPTQAMLSEFLRQGRLEPNIERLKQTYGPRCQAAIEAVRRHLPGVPFAAPEGGFFLGLTLPEGANTQNLLARAKDAGLLLTDGQGFFADPSTLGPAGPADAAAAPERFVRIPFCAITPQQLDEGVRRLAQVIA